MTSHWLGVDIGTYNSSAAIKLISGVINLIRSSLLKTDFKFLSVDQDENLKEFPSFISFREDGSIDDVGISSKEKTFTSPELVVWGIKRLLGKTYSELKENGELDRFPYRIRPNRQNGQCLISVGDKAQ